MAVVKLPRITSDQRANLVLEASEIVYDVDKKAFFGGDGTNIGGFLVGQSGSHVERIVLTEQHLSDKSVILSKIPASPASVMLTPEEGIPQVNGIDFTVNGNILSWDSLGLDNFLEINEVLVIQY
jgi:hypothetical protein